MAIYTPQGLKISLDVPTSFGLMARLYPEIKPASILKTTESISVMTSSLGFVTGILCFALQLSPSNIAICTLFAMTVGILLTFSGIVLFPFLQLGAMFSHIYGLFLPTLIAVAIGFVLTGWTGVASYMVSRLVASTVSILVGIGFTRLSVIDKGSPISSAERNFFNAYRYHALQIGKSTSLELSKDELHEAYWSKTYQDYDDARR
ncbi:hypothetical protein [Paenibacillus qinlingensis]|uniref:hypothetical protein n=1 Tax=Paenibacillus qinlingensis TaxID=1837343 RepID=UPI001566DD02|nr:hypothetical protein [Paenibacillus qinlingensis]NQX59138.1 hypothetical protein [Paenibacillus qinlingensis]